MINPNENDLTRDEPLPAQLQPSEEEIGSTGREQFRRATNKISTAMSQTWDETKEKAGRARERTRIFRARKSRADDPRGAGDRNRDWSWRSAMPLPAERKAEIEVKSPLGDLNWSVLSLPFLWPLFKSARKNMRIGRSNGRCNEGRRQTVEKNRREPLRKADPQTLESVDALSCSRDR